MEKLTMDNLKHAYAFTTENLVAYQNVIDFKDKTILSVVGSGDQYFSSILYGAKEIDLFDNNLTALYHFYLKYYSIMALSYEEFLNNFIYYKNNYYDKVKEYLQDEVREFFDKFFSTYQLEDLVFKNFAVAKDNNERVIPYLNENNYYKLQELLRSKTFPNIILKDLLSLYEVLDKEYDVMFFSNIYAYLNMSVKKYRLFLKKYEKYLSSSGVIVANYEWLCFDKNFKNYGFKSHLIDTALPDMIEYSMNDNILTLKKTHLKH